MAENQMFVKLDKYKEVFEIIEVIDKKITHVKQILSEVDELKKKEDEEIINWEKSIDEVSHKIELIKEDLGQE
jgi:hypothetical protein